MNIFIYEWTCALGGSGGLSRSLCTEGWAMFAALVEDFARLPTLRCLTLLEESFPHDLGTVCQRIRAADEPAAFRRLAAQAEATVVIAPECDNILLDRCRWAREAGSWLLGPQHHAIALTADKLQLAQHLAKRGVPTPPVVASGEWRVASGEWNVVSRHSPLAPRHYLCKPKFGAGSQATFLISKMDEIPATLEKAQLEMAGEFLLQPFVPGIAASVAFLVGKDQRVPLLPAYQHLSDDGRFHYLGGSIPLPGHLADRAVHLANRAIETVAGLEGYIGIDLVLGTAADGSQDVVIEINPRLTTSYLGLRQLAVENLAEVMLRLAQGQEAAPLHWRPEAVHFFADGRVEKGRVSSLS